MECETMRMWMIDPKLLCRKHLLGEHYEIHKSIGNLRSGGNWVMSLTKNGYLEPQNFKKRHDMIVAEMTRRGYKHDSPVNDDFSRTVVRGHVDVKMSVDDLILRCEDCKNNIYALLVRCEK